MPTSLGLVGITNKGNYDAQTPYVKGNFVYYNGSTWLLKVATATGIEPNENNSTTWQYLAKGFNVLPFEGATASADGTGGTVPQPLAGDEGKFLKGDGSWANVPNPSTMTGATSSDAGTGGLVPQPLAGDEDKVLQGNGTFGKKLQIDVVKQGNEYGYINSNNVFVPFKSQADIDAAVSAAKVGDAVAGDVRSGKTFTNATTSGVVGTFEGQEKTVTASDNAITVSPDSGKWLSQVNINPKLRFQAGRLTTRRSIDGWSDTWVAKTWNGVTDITGSHIWTDGDNVYFSYGARHYVLDKATSTWVTKTWNGLTSFYGSNIWTDGDNVYCSFNEQHYVLNKSTSTWTTKTWNVSISSFNSSNIWTDGTNIYYSYPGYQFILNKSTSTWTTKTWNGFSYVIGQYIWTDGDNIYWSNGTVQYVLNKSTSTWTTKTWSGFNIIGPYIWTDGNNIYYSGGNNQYVLNKSTSTWVAKTWSGLTSVAGDGIWTDGNNIYQSSGSSQYVLNKVKTHWVV